jgi:hypothetical protein
MTTENLNFEKALKFENESDYITILKRDKHTRLEGLCTEYLFIDEIIKNKFENFSSGYWFSLKNNLFNITKVLTNIDDFKELDYKILNFFLKNNVSTWVVYFNESLKLFEYIKYTNEIQNNIDFSKGLSYPKSKKIPFLPKITERNIARQEQAIEFLANRNALKKVALERAFANFWLGSGSFWDIDCFTFYKEKLIAFEVKQKYPTAKGTFGLNTGVANLFGFLSSLKIEVIHIILTKPINDEQIHAIDFYTKNEYIAKSNWIATKFSNEILSNNTSTAPNKTSIFGNYQLKYYHIQPNKFHFLKKLYSEPNLLIEFIDSKTHNINSLFDLNS